MHLAFDKLVIENFKSFRGKHILDFTKLDDGLIFLRGRNEVEPRLGSNGAGKSTLLGALSWCLFGKTPEGLRNPDIMPWNDRTTPTVTAIITFDNEPHRITRTASPNALTLDGKALNQENLDQKLGLSYDLFHHAILLGQGQPLFFDLPSRDKMDLFSSTLALDNWERRSALASERARSLERLQDTLTGELSGNESQQQEITKLLADLREKSERWQQQLLKAQEDDANQIKVYQEEHDKLFNKHIDAVLARDGAGTELKALGGELQQLNEYLIAAREEETKHKTEIKHAHERSKKLKAEIETYAPGNPCPVCKQPIKSKTLEKHRKHLQAERSALLEIIKVGIPNAVQSCINNIYKQINNVQIARSQFQHKLEEAESILNILAPQLSTLQVKIHHLQERKKEQEQTDNPYQGQIKETRRRQTELVVEARERRKRLDKLAGQIERTRFWVKGFRDVELYIIEEVLHELELTTNAYLDDIGLLDWYTTYAIEKETKSGTIKRGLNVTIQSPRNKRAVRWEAWSGGEAQRLRLLGALALSEVLLNRAGVTSDLIVLDEPSQHLSMTGIRDMCGLLSDRGHRLKQRVIMVDHRAIESAQFMGTLTVIKTSKGSVLTSV